MGVRHALAPAGRAAGPGAEDEALALARDKGAAWVVAEIEGSGIQGRGGFYDATGTIRDVIQNHLFHVVANFAMEPPARRDSESIRDEKVKVLKAIQPLGPENVIRGRFRGYRSEAGVAPDSRTETFAALRLDIDSPRWKGVPTRAPPQTAPPRLRARRQGPGDPRRLERRPAARFLPRPARTLYRCRQDLRKDRHPCRPA
jgi:hypothetical protein